MAKEGFFKKHKKSFRWVVRLIFLALSIFLVIGGPLPEAAARVIPALSPLAVVSAALAHRAWYISFSWSIPALLLLGLALWKGRFFCRWICPLGTVYSIPSQVSRKKRFFPWKLNGIIFWITIGAAAVGLPLMLFLDPLSTFMRFGVMGRGTAHVIAWIPGALIPLMLLLSLIQPMLWCTQLCPLGYFVELIQLKKKPKEVYSRSRRELLTGLTLGIPLAFIFKNVARAVKRPILPPGAKDLDNFAATCIRCYACVNACPTGVLTAKTTGGVAEFCIPALDFDLSDGSYCEQYCNACSQVCPTGAIKSLTMEEKQQRKIATASIVREACLAWEDRQECLACDEFCGYNAFEIRTGKDGIPKPVVKSDKCRGCGACRNICPAIRIGNAVDMQPVIQQRFITPEEDASTNSH